MQSLQSRSSYTPAPGPAADSDTPDKAHAQLNGFNALAHHGRGASQVVEPLPSSEPAGSSSWGARLFRPLVVVLWFASNIGLLLMNKALLSTYGFRHPICLTLFHMAACVVFGSGATLVGLAPAQALQSRRQAAKVAVLGCIFALSIILGNLALVSIPVSFSQAIGATTPAFTAWLGFMLFGVRESTAVYLTLIPVMIGMIINSGFEPSFHLLGFVAAGVLLVDQSEKLDSVNLLRWMSPIALAVLVPAALVMEPGVLQSTLLRSRGDPLLLGLLAGNALLAALVNLLNFLVTRYTSALTLQVLGNAKGVVAAGVSVLLFRNPVSAVATVGYVVTVSGVYAYAIAKRHGSSLPK